jgi:hypothetical protein
MTEICSTVPIARSLPSEVASHPKWPGEAALGAGRWEVTDLEKNDGADYRQQDPSSSASRFTKDPGGLCCAVQMGCAVLCSCRLDKGRRGTSRLKMVGIIYTQAVYLLRRLSESSIHFVHLRTASSVGSQSFILDNRPPVSFDTSIKGPDDRG